jgi:hypothetical protein
MFRALAPAKTAGCPILTAFLFFAARVGYNDADITTTVKIP